VHLNINTEAMIIVIAYFIPYSGVISYPLFLKTGIPFKNSFAHFKS